MTLRRLVAATVVAIGAAAFVDRLLSRATWARPSGRPIRSLVVIDAPLDVVWEAISDIAAQPLWMHEMKAVRVTTPGPVGVGTVGEADVRILGIGVTDPVEIAGWEPPTRFAIRHLGRFSGGGEIRLRAGTDGSTTIVDWDEVLVPPALPELGALVQRPVLARIFQDDLHRFRRLVESGELPRPTG
jgi:uncharacterized membrane protein